MGMRLNGAGGGRYRLGQNSDINITPFVDVMLVLMIIFMVALPPATKEIKLNLPRAEAPSQPVEPPVVVSVRPNGAIFIDDAASSMATLPADLARRLNVANPTAERVFIRADRGARYSMFMTVINRLHGAGYEQLGVVNEAL